ncbi:hypothetical protein LTR94_037224, partial [Friedmanniomyces endolithicus]
MRRTGDTGTPPPPVELKFGNTGALIAPATGTLAFDPFIPASGAAQQQITLSLAGSTQLSSASSVNSRSQDGVAVGQLAGVT